MSYALLDSGDGRRLEQVGPYRLSRQAAAAFWKPRRPELWRTADAVHHREESGGGRWEFRRALPERWEIGHGGVRMFVKPTPFGHLGLFAEHVAQWAWMEQVIRAAGRPVRVLNLFAYTGGASLVCARAGAEVTHVDAARGVVDWARDNAQLNGLTGIRWVVEDAAVYVQREVKRSNRYDGILLDPPTFGRGAKKELWKIEEHLNPLLASLRGVLSADPLFAVLSCHTPGYGGITLANLMEDWLGPGTTESGEMAIPGSPPLASGSFARRRW